MTALYIETQKDSNFLVPQTAFLLVLAPMAGSPTPEEVI